MSIIKHRFLNNVIQPDTEILIIGTFNPDTPKNKADFFYGRPRNFLWTLLPQSFHESDLKQSTIEEKKNFIKKHKIGFVDLIETVEVEEGKEGDYYDNYLDKRVKKWKNIPNLIKEHPGIQKVCFTRITFGGIPNIAFKIREIEEYCLYHRIKFACLLTPARFVNEKKQRIWNEFFN
jgi:G:T/U-mismatch repair DNA glycosylase